MLFPYTVQTNRAISKASSESHRSGAEVRCLSVGGVYNGVPILALRLYIPYFLIAPLLPYNEP